MENQGFVLAFCAFCHYNNNNYAGLGGDDMGEVIAVLSGKGGTGKTSVCAAVATALSQMGEKVLCIDCDIGLRNLDIALGLSDLAAISFLDVCRGDYPVTMATVHPVFPNLQFLTAPMNCPAADVDYLEFSQMLSKAREQFQYIFLAVLRNLQLQLILL